ncbi:hypothetical protein ALC62_01572 [Cyphomyrmex costatus]|uniref:Uncharacterized protein n=1 Tax=Cyphomyrmex costatus TaxID=456900 RepID=A0A195D382_9HYME|nr:hypothetical protein ALC62_01572 [Cyphomyrmex costatus]
MYNASAMRHRAVQKSLARHAVSRMPDLRNCESGALCGDEARRVADDILALLLTVSPPAQQHVQPSLVPGRYLRVGTRDVINATSLQRDTDVSIFLSTLWRTDGYPTTFT